MKTFNSIFALLALLMIGCSASDDGVVGEEKPTPSIDADYAVVLNTGPTLSPQLLNANAEVLTLNPEASSLAAKAVPELTAMLGGEFLQYHKTGCTGTITTHDFGVDETQDFEVFADLEDCMLTANALIASDAIIAIAYEREIDAKSSDYAVRIIDRKSADLEFIDIPLNKKPEDMAIANNRLFIKTLDVEISDENYLSVIDLGTNSAIHEMNLGFRARRVFTTTDDAVIISYDELHTTLNSSNLSFVFTNYGEGTEPQFTTDHMDYFDADGLLYYPKASESVSSYPEIPAVYDFSENLITLYAFENFLTEEKRDFEFEIETTTAVTYDAKNGFILIGYKKVGAQEGGLLRIKPTPEPAFIDQIDLDGVPYAIFVN